MLDSSNRRLVYDCEANNLLDKVTKVWCIAAQDYETDEIFLYHDYPQFNNAKGIDEAGNEFVIPKRNGSLAAGAKFINDAKQRIAHNCIGYDERLLKKFFPKFQMKYGYPEVRDTLLESQVQWFDRPTPKGAKGAHGLHAWGIREGINKPPIEDWSFIDAAKLHRCIEDIKINTRVARTLEAERAELLERCEISFIKALEVENEYRYNMTQQELNGALIDVPHVKRCIKDLDDKLSTLKEELEPQLPPNVKYKAGKVTLKDIAEEVGLEALGLSKMPPVKTRIVQRDGHEDKVVPITRWHKPTLKYTKVIKQNTYKIVTSDGKEGKKVFYKVKEARDHAKKIFDNTKGFKYPKTVVETEVYDHHTCNHFELEEDDFKDGLIGGPFTKVTFEKTLLSQHYHVKSLLVRLGWKPDEWTYKKEASGRWARAEETHWIEWPKNIPKELRLRVKVLKRDLIPVSPKLTESSYDSLPEGLGLDIAHYNTYTHRRKYLQNEHNTEKGILNNLREDGRITCGIMTFGTNSGRASHYGVVNLPGAKSLYGKEMREMIVASEGYTLVGVDMPNCHPRILSFLCQNETFLAAVRSGSENDEDGNFIGTDFHTVNAVLFSMIDEGDLKVAVETQDKDLIRVILNLRGAGKACSFTCLYGGSGAKLAQTIGGISDQEGEQRKQDFIEGLGLDVVLAMIEKDWKKHKHFKGNFISVMGGYHIWCNSQHKMINTMAIGSEAALQKYSVNWIAKEIDKHNLDVKIIASFHDEVLFEVADEDLEAFKPIGARFYEEGAQLMGIDNDFMSDCLIGKNYYECH